MNRQQLIEKLKDAGGLIRQGYMRFVSLMALVFGCYIVASTLSSGFIQILGLDSLNVTESPVLANNNPVKFTKEINMVAVRRSVLTRNLFNADGEFPDESEPEVDLEPSAGKVFDEAADCPQKKTTLNVELLGTIAMGSKNPQSLATIKEKGYNYADIYRVGETIYGNDGVVIHAIQDQVVVINNNGKKECLEYKPQKDVFAENEARDRDSDPMPPSKPKDDDDDTPSTPTRVVLENSYVTDALGAGYAKVLKEGRFVPFNRDGKIIGFKLVGVKSNSLFSKVGMGSGDVLTSVNGISMAQPEQGFAFLAALADEKEIRVEFLKKGKDPTTVTIEVR